MKVIDAFAGLGGFSLAADALGWDTVAFVEWDKDCQFWLGEHWPNVPIYGDITTVRWEDAPRCDIFTAGFPCQPHSVAGKRAASDDSRDLWSECVRAISTLRPRYAVLENVSGLLTSESGRFFNRVISDLAKIGYVGRYDVLSAAECGAPHRRERVWIVAYPSDDDGRGRECGTEAGTRPDGERGRGHRSSSMGHSASGGRRTGEGEPVRRPLGEREGVGNAENERCEGLRASGEQEPRPYARSGLSLRGSPQLCHPWFDAIPYRGADGTVRLIPRGAVAESAVAGLSERDGARIGAARPRDAEPERGSGFIQPEEEVSRPEPALRVVVDGLSDNVAGRHAAKEGAPSLWPVTDSEPRRVARLKAVGNSVVPAWVLAGPFQFILDREGLRDNEPAV